MPWPTQMAASGPFRLACHAIIASTTSSHIFHRIPDPMSYLATIIHHPGSPDISDDQLRIALAEKNAWAMVGQCCVAVVRACGGHTWAWLLCGSFSAAMCWGPWLGSASKLGVVWPAPMCIQTMVFMAGESGRGAGLPRDTMVPSMPCHGALCHSPSLQCASNHRLTSSLTTPGLVSSAQLC